MDKGRKSKHSQSSTEEPKGDQAPFDSAPEVMGPTRSISDIIATNHKTRDQQIEELQTLIEEQSLQLKLTEAALQAHFVL